MSNSYQHGSYSAIDVSPYNIKAVPGEIYYRLKMVDEDGKFSYSKIQEVSFSGNANDELLLYPNPVKNEFRLRTASACTVSLYDENGRLVKMQMLLPGTNTINISSLSAGTYFCLIGGKALKVIKQ